MDIFTVDAFTETPFSGNPAAVCPLKKPLDDDVYQKIAMEMNLSETAYLVPLEDATDFKTCGNFSLRWFTPTVEVPLCGHATLATSHILFNHYKNVNSVIKYQTLSGDVSVSISANGSIQIDFPQWELKKLDTSQLDRFSPFIQECVMNLPVKDLAYVQSARKLIIVLDENVDRRLFESLSPNTTRLRDIDPTGTLVKGITVTMKGTTGNGCTHIDGTVYDFVARYFAPWLGVPEDPVTGSLYCGLGPYWANVLQKNKFFVRQCSPRGGVLNVELRGDGRVYLYGKAVTVLQGQFVV